MNRSSLIVSLTVAALVVLTLGLKCGGGVPSVPTILSAPESTWINAPTEIRVVSTVRGNKDIRYVIDIGFNNITDTSEAYASGDSSARVEPMWTQVGTYQYKIQAILDEDPTKASEWTAPRQMKVLPNNPPGNLQIQAPMVAVKDVPAPFTVSAEDSDGDSIQFYFNFGDGTKGWVDTMLPTPATLTVFHTFKSIDTFWVKVKARDKKRSECAPESIEVPVGTAGAVLWYAAPGEEEPGDSFPLVTAPVILTLTDDTLIYSGCSDDGKFYAITLSRGRKKYTGTPENIDFSDFNSHPAYCAYTSHIIVGNSGDGRLYAFNTSLRREWVYPRDSVPGREWSPAAINGNKIYVVNSAAGGGSDSLMYFEDQVGNVNRVAAYRLSAPIVENQAPVIDQQGNVYFGTVAGTLVKMPANIQNPEWTLQLQATGDIRSLAIDGTGTIYCCSNDSGRVYAVNSATGQQVWSAPAAVPEPTYIVVGPNGVYVATDAGKLFLLDAATGAVKMEKQVSATDLPVAPVLAANNKLYCQDYDDVLYCLTADNLELVWACNCPAQVHGSFKRARRLISDNEASPTIGPNGNIIVVGSEYIYCVIGYPESPLANAAWPKWQRDLGNTGKFVP
ncbi:MAG: PQQ-binding-like beta-propeller repeat protein [candidate division WOR-3 bacterium]